MPRESSAPTASAWSPYGVLVAAIFALLLLTFAYNVASVLLLLFLATLFALYLGLITDWLQDRWGLPRPLGILAALIFTGLAVTGIGWLVVPPVLAQAQGVFATLPNLARQGVDGLREWVARYPLLASAFPPEEIDRQVQEMLGKVGGYFAGLIPYLFGGLHAAINAVSVLVMGIFIAVRPELYREGVISLAPPVHRELVRDILADLGRSLRAWIGGQILAMFVLGALTYVGLVLLKVPYALAFGVFTGVVVMVPFFGSLISTLLPAFFVLGGEDGGLVRGMLVILLGVVIHVIEANLIHPLIMQSRVHLPPVLSILSVLIMAELLGPIGLVVAVPVLATVMVVVRRIYVHRLLEGKGFRRFVRDAPAEIRVPEAALRLPTGAVSIPAVLEEAGAAPR